LEDLAKHAAVFTFVMEKDWPYSLLRE